MKKRIVFKAKIVLGSSAAVLIVFGGHSVMAQTSATGSATKTHEQALREIIRQEDEKFAPRQLPPPTDVDPKLTEESRRLEQQFCDAILAKDAKILDRLLGPEFKRYYRRPGLQRRFLRSRLLEEKAWRLAGHSPVLRSGG